MFYARVNFVLITESFC